MWYRTPPLARSPLSWQRLPHKLSVWENGGRNHASHWNRFFSSWFYPILRQKYTLWTTLNIVSNFRMFESFKYILLLLLKSKKMIDDWCQQLNLELRWWCSVISSDYGAIWRSHYTISRSTHPTWVESEQLFWIEFTVFPAAESLYFWTTTFLSIATINLSIPNPFSFVRVDRVSCKLCTQATSPFLFVHV